MTPEEKAKELIDRFNNIEECDNHHYQQGYVCSHQAKQCALIAVDEAILYHPLPNAPDERDKQFHEYWRQVKQIIEKQ